MFAATLTLLFVAPVSLPDPTDAVHWSAPPSCPDAQAARTAIAAPLGRASDLDIRVTVEQVGRGFRAQLAITVPAGQTTRELDSPSCATVLDTVVLIAGAAEQAHKQIASPGPRLPSVAGEPDPRLQLSAGQRERLARELAADAARLDAEDDGDDRDRTERLVPPPRPPSTSRPPVAAHARGFGLLGWGVTPVVDGGGGGALGVSVGRWRVEALVRAVAATEVTIVGLPTAAARVHAWSAGARGCGIAWASGDERWALPICAGASAGAVVGAAVGTGLAIAAPRRQVWAAAHAGPALVVRLARWLSLVADAALLVPIRRPGFSVRGAPQLVHRIAPVGIWGTIGVEVHFVRRIFARTGMP